MAKYFFFIGLIILGSCNEPPVVAPPVEGTSENIFDLNWAVRMDPEKEWVTTNYAHVWGDWFIKGGDNDAGFSVHFYNKVTGDIDWSFWHEGANDINVNSSLIVENVYFGINSKGIVAIDLNTKNMLWELDLRALDIRGNSSVSFWKGYLYHSVDLYFKEENHTHQLLKINIVNGEFEEIFKSELTDTFYEKLSPVTFYEDKKNGRDLMIANLYPDAGWQGTNFAKQKIWIYDLNTGKELMRTENFIENNSQSTLYPPIVHEDIVITTGDVSIFGIHLYTGETLWTYEYNHPLAWGLWGTTNHLMHDNRLYVNNTLKDVTCLNPITGELIWNNPEGGSNCTDNMLYYKDKLVFTSWGFGSVMILDALTGETVHMEQQYDDSNYNNDIAYDEETDMFFTSTYKHVMGFKINVPE